MEHRSPPPPSSYSGPMLPPLLNHHQQQQYQHPQQQQQQQQYHRGLAPPSPPAPSLTHHPAKRRPSSGPSDEGASPHPQQQHHPGGGGHRPPHSPASSDWRPQPKARRVIVPERERAPLPRPPPSPATSSSQGTETGADPRGGGGGGMYTVSPSSSFPPADPAAAAARPQATTTPATTTGAPPSSSSSATSPYVRRKRALAACQFCRLRKTKCDNARPVCGSCRHHQAKCVYTDGSEGDGSQVGLDEAASRHREVLERLDDIRNLLARSSPSAGSGSGSGSGAGGAGADARSSGTSEMGAGSEHVSFGVSPLPGSGGGSGVANGLDQESSVGLGGGAGGAGGAVEMESVSDGQAAPSATAYLQHTKCESVLKWPVLAPVMTEEDAAIDSFIFDAYVRGDGDERDGAGARSSASPASTRSMSQQPRFKGKPFPPNFYVPLCQKFLALVNCRNPIVGAHDLMSYARSVAEDGLDWDARSCLVLLACALASYSRAWTPPPFVHSTPSPSARTRRESTVPPEVMSTSDDEVAEVYYEEAQKRLGLLGTSLIDVQCFYYASLFERFAFRPLQACMYLQQAASRLRFHHMGQRGEEKRSHMAGQDDERAESRHSSVTYHLEQRAFWSIHKGEREYATELGIKLASDLTGFKYPAAFPTPPEALHHLIPSDDGDEGMDDDLSDVFSPRRNEVIWYFYLAEISLRRTFDEVLSVIYEKGEQNWIENIELVCRQYHESEKQISEWQSHLPGTMRYDPTSQPNNEMAYYLEGRMEEWNECILRPLVYYCLHSPPGKPPPPAIVALGQRDMTLCVNCIMRCASHGRHGGTWVVLRRTFRCTLIILAAVLAEGPLRPPENWQELTGVSIATLRRWAPGVRDLQRMGRVLERVFRAVCEVDASRMPVEVEVDGQGRW